MRATTVAARRIVVLLSGAILLSGCSPSGSGFIDAEHAKAGFEGRSLTILPIAEGTIDISAIKGIERDFDGDPRSAEITLRDSIYSIFGRETRRAIKGVSMLASDLGFSAFPQVHDSTRYFSFTGRLPEDTTIYSFNVPRKEWISSLGKEIDIALFVDRIVFGTDTSREKPPLYPPLPSHNPERPMIASPLIHEHLSSVCSYVFWDYRKNQPVAYGFAQYEAPVAFGEVEKSYWLYTFKYLARAIFYQSPFEWKTLDR